MIDEAVRVDYGSIPQLAGRFKEDDTIPFLRTIRDKPRFLLLQLHTPFEVTDQRHRIYQKGAVPDGACYNFEGPELVSRLSYPGAVQIIYSGSALKLIYYLDAENFTNTFAEYHILLTPKRPSAPQYFIFGADSCIKQLEEWGIRVSDIGELAQLLMIDRRNLPAVSSPLIHMPHEAEIAMAHQHR
ncbi:hypothetical protein HY637_06245 [Candidatus Woesearchaeota archaeon]|nr:hypothetical protein [Candidatus Woesearchaeota archaeon]